MYFDKSYRYVIGILLWRVEPIACINFATRILSDTIMKAIDTRIIKVLVAAAALTYTVYLFAKGSYIFLPKAIGGKVLE